jgi:thiosulfate/3-mercaptopyruvate sulfurtransferase
MSMPENKSRFVAPFDEVEAQLGRSDFKIIDASWYLPAQNRNAEAEFQSARIPGAQRFDLDAVVALGSTLPHMLPTPDMFAAALGAIGVSDTDDIVVYDGPGLFSAPRVWWMLRVFGATRVRVLDGGFDAWRREGRPIENGAVVRPRPATFQAGFNAQAVASFADISAIIADRSSQIADARGAGRFAGTETEPRAGLRSGHMPGARNLPFSALSNDGKLLPLNALREVLEASGIDLEKPVVTTCGSGVTAAVVTLALQSLGHADNRLYDGSWAEWGGRLDTAIETGTSA